MPDYRIIGYYDDNQQVFDDTRSGKDSAAAVAGLADDIRMDGARLMVVAVLDDAGKNLHQPIFATPVDEWEAD